jgi:4-hydroxy-tetrahydrodipicolinate synthase
VILYNIPGNTHNLIELETVLELAGEPNIVGIKDTTGNFIPFSRSMLENSLDGIVWIQGEDYLDTPALLLGANGLVTGLANDRIEPYVQMREAIWKGDLGKLREAQTRIDILYEIIRLCSNSVVAVKAATELSGRGSRWLLQKSLSAKNEQMEWIRQLLEMCDRDYPCRRNKSLFRKFV